MAEEEGAVPRSRSGRPGPVASWGAATAVTALVTLLLWSWREDLSEAHKTLAYLLVVLVVSARGGRAVGLSIAAASFLAFNFFLLTPYYTLHLDDPLDWSVLLGFLATAGVAAQLFHRERELRATQARLATESARRAVEESRVTALHEADRLKDAFVASVSHDLRTPLTTIRALAVEMRDADQERALVIEEEADRLNRLVTDLLDLSRLRAGGVRSDLQVVAAEDVVGAALQRLSGLRGAHRIVVRLPSDTLPAARLDFVQTLRILTNLLENALRHSPPDEPVELVVAIDDGSLTFKVHDRGPGVGASDRRRIFEPFQKAVGNGIEREEVAADGLSSGAGLGLAIARSLAEAQGGTLELDARAGGGSSFTLSLPAVSVPPSD